MAKAKTATKPAEERSGKTRFELRFSDGLYERMKHVCDRADISVNQFMQGLAEWATRNAVVGEPDRDETGFVRARSIPGVVFFGETGKRLTKEEREDIAEMAEVHPREIGDAVGKVFFTLDFTERRVVRDEEENRSGPAR